MKISGTLLRIALSLLLVLFCTRASAEATEAQRGASLKKCHVSRLQPYEPSYGVFQRAEHDNWTLRAHYSFRYVLYPVKPSNEVESRRGEPCLIPSVVGLVSFLKYTGEFDFYWRFRPSSPVVNRISNPGVHFRWYEGTAAGSLLRWIDAGLEHFSDGQTTEVTEPADAARARQAYDQKDYQFFDTISRGMNFLSAEVQLGKPQDDRHRRFYAKVRLYLSKDTNITWGPLAGSGTTISDYERFRFLWSQDIGPGEASVTWTLGDKWLATDSWDVDYLWSKMWRLTLYFRYHYGPLQTLSNYTEARQSFGVGLKFTP